MHALWVSLLVCMFFIVVTKTFALKFPYTVYIHDQDDNAAKAVTKEGWIL